MFIKNGVLILGSRPMFDMDENIGVAVKKAIFKTFGGYPIIYVHEDWTVYSDDEYDEEPTNIRDFTIYLDSEKIDLIDDFRMGYVTTLFEKIIGARQAGRNELDTTASQKYCFSDTEDWWDAAKVDGFDSERARFELEVTI